MRSKTDTQIKESLDQLESQLKEQFKLDQSHLLSMIIAQVVDQMAHEKLLTFIKARFESYTAQDLMHLREILSPNTSPEEATLKASQLGASKTVAKKQHNARG